MDEHRRELTASRPREHWRSSISATPDRVSSPRRFARAAWSSIRGCSTGALRHRGEPERLRRRAQPSAARCTRTRRSAHPWLREEKALLAELLERGVAAARRLPRRAAARRGGGRAAAPGERAGDRLVRGGADTGGGAAIPCSGPLGPALRGVPVAQLRVPPAPAAPPRWPAAPLCLQAYRLGDAAWGIQFHAEVTARGRRGLDRRLPQRRGRGSHRPRPRRLRERTRGAIGAWNELGRGLCERFLAAAATRA